MLHFSRNSRVLVLAPHTDDAELGVGGTLIKLRDLGATVSVAVFSIAEKSVPPGYPNDILAKEFSEAMQRLGIPKDHQVVFRYPVREFPQHRQSILENLIVLRETFDPTVVFLPSSQDIHQDHQVVFNEGVRAFKTKTILGYEFPWNQLKATSNFYVELSGREIEAKWTLLLAYQTQLGLKRGYFSRDLVFSLARLRGVQVGADFAEAFEAIRVFTSGEECFSAGGRE